MYPSGLSLKVIVKLLRHSHSVSAISIIYVNRYWSIIDPIVRKVLDGTNKPIAQAPRLLDGWRGGQACRYPIFLV